MFVERDFAFQARQVRAEAVMHALAEREVADVVAVDVERVRVLVAGRITIGRAEKQQDGAASRDSCAVTLEIPCHVAGYMRTGGLEAQGLVDGAH